MGEYVSLNSKQEDVEKNSGLVWLIYMSSNIFGGVFLLVIFMLKTGESGYSVQLIKEIFLGLTVISFTGRQG